MRKGVMTAERREKSGSGASSRLRRGGRVPGILYGGGAAPTPLSVGERELQAAMKGGVRIVELAVAGETHAALLKDVQYDYLGDRCVHVDFQRLVKGERIHIRVPLVFRGTPAGLKDGGVFNVLHDTLAVECLPEDIPEEVGAEVSGLAMGESVHVRDITLPKGVVAVEDADDVLAVVTYSDREVAAVAAAPEEAATQPEVIGEAERKAAAEAKGAEAAKGGGKEAGKEGGKK